MMTDMERTNLDLLAAQFGGELAGEYVYSNSRWYRAVEDPRGRLIWSHAAVRPYLVELLRARLQSLPETTDWVTTRRLLATNWGLNQLMGRLARELESAYGLPAPVRVGEPELPAPSTG